MYEIPAAKSNQCILCLRKLGTYQQLKTDHCLLTKHRIHPKIQKYYMFEKNICFNVNSTFTCYQCMPKLMLPTTIIKTQTDETPNYECIAVIYEQVIAHIKKEANKIETENTCCLKFEFTNEKQCKSMTGLLKENIERLSNISGACHVLLFFIDLLFIAIYF